MALNVCVGPLELILIGLCIHTSVSMLVEWEVALEEQPSCQLLQQPCPRIRRQRTSRRQPWPFWEGVARSVLLFQLEEQTRYPCWVLWQCEIVQIELIR